MFKKVLFIFKEALSDIWEWIKDFNYEYGSALVIVLFMLGLFSTLVFTINKTTDFNAHEELLKENAILKQQIVELEESQTTVKYVEVVEVQMVDQESLQEPTVEPAVHKDIHEKAGSMYNIDPNILRAIERHETGNYTSNVYRMYNNTYGGQIPTPQGRYFLRYNSPDESTMALAKLLRNNYYNQGMNTLEKIQPVYCPNGEAPGPNNSWVRSVTAIYWEEVSEHGTY